MSAFQYKTERDRAVNGMLDDGYEGIVLRVRCRELGAHRWFTFLLVPDDEGEDYAALEAKAPSAAAEFMAWKLKGGRV